MTHEGWSAAAPGPWLAIALLGVYHGVNPAMGWLFAVALGLQQQSRRAVLRALFPIAVGHEASIVAVALVVGGIGLVAAPDTLRVAAAVALVLFGAYKLLRPASHPRWVGMRLGTGDLALWSFLMSTAQGAGLMLIPALLGFAAGATSHGHSVGAPHDHVGGEAAFAATLDAAALVPNAVALLVHALAMLVAMGIVALLVYEKLGLNVLRRAWINVDAVWAVAVIGAGLFTLFS